MIDIVMISTMSRLDLLEQSLESLGANTADDSHSLTLVLDDPQYFPYERKPRESGMRFIINAGSQGASASRNIGASSIPRYRRGSHVMFLDDDVFMCPKWDERLMELAESLPNRIISGHAHPFNHATVQSANYCPYPRAITYAIPFGEPLVISTVCMMMPWSLWDDVGFFVEPGGPGGSEDFDYCMRAKAKGYGFAVSEPHCVIHCGLTSSSGSPIVGQAEMVAQNQKLVELYGLKGVRFE